MKKSIVLFIVITSLFLVYSCTDSKTESTNTTTAANSNNNYGGFESQVKWGEHLVTIGSCHDCHTPKKMTAAGMDIDSAYFLSGHIGKPPAPDVNRKEMQAKFLVVTGDLTSWVGPWGISYTANLTSDSTGIGLWTESQFMTAIRQGKFKGMPAGRDLLPPMPWQMYRHMTDDELKAIYAFLKTTKPIKNVVPPPVAPAQ